MQFNGTIIYYFQVGAVENKGKYFTFCIGRQKNEPLAQRLLIWVGSTLVTRQKRITSRV